MSITFKSLAKNKIITLDRAECGAFGVYLMMNGYYIASVQKAN